MSIALCNIAGIYEAKNELERALEFYEKDVMISKRLVADYPQNPCYKRDLSVSFEKVAGIHEAKKEPGKALESYEEALSIRKQLVSDYPQSSQYAEDLAIVYFFIGLLTEDDGYFKTALEYAKRFPDMPKCKKITEYLTGE